MSTRRRANGFAEAPTDAQRNQIRAREAVDGAASAARRARRKFFDELDDYMLNNTSPAGLVAAARSMWLADAELRALQERHGVASQMKTPAPPSRRKKTQGRRDVPFKVTQVLPGSFGSGKRR